MIERDSGPAEDKLGGYLLLTSPDLPPHGTGNPRRLATTKPRHPTNPQRERIPTATTKRQNHYPSSTELPQANRTKLTPGGILHLRAKHQVHPDHPSRKTGPTVIRTQDRPTSPRRIFLETPAALRFLR